MTNKIHEQQFVYETDFSRYIQLLHAFKERYLIIILVCDTGCGQCFITDYANEVMGLGLNINMLNRHRYPYIAILDHGKLLEERSSERLDMPVVVEEMIGCHEAIIYSAGFYCQRGVGCRALVMIDGVNYMNGGRGLNFFVFDTERDRIVDSVFFDFWTSGRGQRNHEPSQVALFSFIKKRVGVTLCTLVMPGLPSKHCMDASKHEHQLVSNPAYWEFFSKNRSDIAGMRKIYENRRYPFCSDYKDFDEFYDSFHFPRYFINLDGTYNYVDHKSHSFNTKNGIRITTNQPKEAKRSVFFVGPSVFIGWGVEDSKTFESQLQKILNENVKEKGIIVYNCAFNGDNLGRDVNRLRSLPVKNGDIVVFHSRFPIWGIPCCDLSLASVRPHDYGEIFIDDTGHFTYNGNRMIAEGLYDFFRSNAFFEKKFSADIRDPINVGECWNEKEDIEEDMALQAYKKKLKAIYAKEIGPKVGSIVMNANPFTLGHKHLVDFALAHCDYLVVFVVEEDKSTIPFIDRINLVKQNLADIKNVSIVPSGEFLVSLRTFKEYFNKESLQTQKIDTSLDATLFAKEIAPCLNISLRFVGEEPFDNVTSQYHDCLERLLPQYGIELVQIPRLECNGKPILGTDVRCLAQAKKFETLAHLVPPPTLDYLKKRYE